MIRAAKVLNFQSNLLLAVHYEIMYPYLKNKRYEINKQANTMQSLFSYIRAQRNSAEKILLKNPVEEILLKKFPLTSTGLIWLDFFIEFSITRFIRQICNPVDEIPLKKSLQTFCHGKPNEEILLKKSFQRNPVEEIPSKIILTGILDIISTRRFACRARCQWAKKCLTEFWW